MKEPGLDRRHRDKNPPKGGQIDQKHSDALNKNLPKPIAGFSANASVGFMRKETGQTSLEGIRNATKKGELVAATFSDSSK